MFYTELLARFHIINIECFWSVFNTYESKILGRLEHLTPTSGYSRFPGSACIYNTVSEKGAIAIQLLPEKSNRKTLDDKCLSIGEIICPKLATTL